MSLLRSAFILALALPLPARAADPARLDEALYGRLLARHTRSVPDLARTRVDYPAMRRSADWRRLVASLDAIDPGTLETRNQKLAFWINAYNILAIDLVAAGYPVDSIRDLGSLWRPVWKQPAGRVGGREVSLDEIEHGIVRPMGEPRAHVAVVCASTSCPALLREPWSAERLDAQLDRAMRGWMADPGKGLRIDRTRGVVHVSKIFDWFEEDFEAVGGVVSFVTRYASEADAVWLRARGSDLELRYLDYDWSANDVGA